MKTDNVVLAKSKLFAVRSIRLNQFLNDRKKEYVLSKQFLRSGTSVGANIREAVRAQSKKDFIAKLSIALKEASETQYWLELLHETEYLSDGQFKDIDADADELIRLLVSIINTSKAGK